ncbi:molybdate-anion transporter [Biomphalaria glabrata]|uniref:Molybdate-anion transporter n=1 Tax=Biomphalaria glabrata TaxID=6526 RepID=A0A2C9K009_BIOGL|nr:molybdate-anion transporter-like [Biomphalaria glabrata]XP_055900584.1 molybdate-anion transporter-like [Biomphalaria glabrata]KAI8761041.1 molybdate-anion transporter-like [Biomphalaria glabrata]KAI8781184.1 molybdate-anion transporter [Biomphalaria glabrata]
MMILAYITFGALSFLCLIFQFWAHRTRRNVTVGNNPQFIKFQRGYFVVYLTAMFADWLQGPYLYKLYSYYGFDEQQIAVLYVFGFASSVIFGAWTPIAADQFGRKKLCVFFTITYSVSCLLKLSTSYGILLIGRLVGGLATSVLFTAFEAWYIHEHLETHDFPKEWIPITFQRASMWNGVLAVMAGVTTNIFSEWIGLGPVAPYLMAVPFLIFVGVIISTHWNENYSMHRVKFRKLCYDGFRDIITSKRIFLVGAIEALFESVVYIVIFLWTPILEQGKPSLGIVFSCFMVCILIGQAIFQILTSKGIPAIKILFFVNLLALASILTCVYSTHPRTRHLNASLVAFLIFQFCVGMYFPAMSGLRMRVIPDTHRYSIMNWFRVPLNLISCAVLMLLHEDVFLHGNHLIFVVCVGLLVLQLLATLKFLKTPLTQEETDEELEGAARLLMEADHIHNIF